MRAVPALVLAATLAAPSVAVAAQPPDVRVQVALDPENWDTRDAGAAIAGASATAEPAPRAIENQLRAAMSEGFFANGYRRRRAYPVIDLAERDIKQGDADAAIAGYERYLQEDPRHLVIRWRLIQLLRERHRYAEVVSNADQLLHSLPNFGLALVQKAQALAALGQAGPAMDSFIQALRLNNLPPSARREALGGVVNAALASGRLAEADSLLAAESPGPPGSPVSLGLLAARATLAERAGDPAQAASLWGRIAADAPPPERRRAILAQAQLLDQAGRARDGLALLRTDPVPALFTPEAGAPPGTRLRYERLLSVLAEQLGETDVAAAASAAAVAASLQPASQGAGNAAAALMDRVRAARLQQRRAANPTAALAFLVQGGERPLDRPAGVDDAAWTDYLLLLADTAQRAGQSALADATLDQLPPAGLQDWRIAARAAEVTERTGHPARAAALWARVAASASGAAERRQALLSQAQLLDHAGKAADALQALDDSAARALFIESSGATGEERLRYERTLSVLAERAGRPDLAREASEQAAALQQQAPGKALAVGALVDRLRAVRLRTAHGGQSPATLTLLLDQNGHLLARPESADDALWTEYTLLLAESAQHAGRLATAREALAVLPPSALQDWRTAARVSELALDAGQPTLALAALRPWDARTLAAAGADQRATLAVLTLRANAAAAEGDRATEGVTAAEIAAIDPRIGNPADRAQRLLAAHDPQAALVLLEAARLAASTRAASAPPAGRAAAQHELAQLLVTLGQAAWQAGQPARAVQALRDSLAAEGSWPVRWQLAETLRKAGRRQEAAAEYRQAAATASNPADTQLAWLTLGDLLYADKEYAAAFDAFRAAVAAGAGAAGRSRMAETADRLGRYADEARALEPLAGDRLWRERLCGVLVKAGEQEQASRCLDQLVAAAGSDAGAWRVAADVAGTLGRTADRTRYLETAFHLTLQPAIGLAAGNGLMQAGRPADAAAVFGAVADQTNDPRAAVARGEALMAAHQPAAAAESLRSALARPDLPVPLQARAYAALGYAQDSDGDPTAAAASWQRALRLGADRGLAVAEAEALLRAGHPGEATAVLASLNALGQEATGTLRSQQEALEVRLALARGDAAAARTRAEALARAQPTAEHLTLLAQARTAAGDKAGAAAASEQAAAAAPDDAQVQAQAGYADYAAGAPTAAARHFEAALARDPNRLGLRQDLGRVYVRAGDWPDARHAYAEAIQRTTAHAAVTGDPHDQTVLQDLRGENAAATQNFAFELVDTLCTPNTAIGCGLSLPLVERLGSAGIGAATVAWSPHIPGDPDPQRIALYARLLWSNDPGSVSILSRTLQGGAGIRVQPVNGIPVYVWAEHLFAIGGESQDNWLLRVTAGWETGAGWRAGGTPGWGAGWLPYLFVYGDLGHFLIRQQDWLGVVEGRVGASHQPFEQVLLVPYVFLRGELDSATVTSASDVQIGAGVSLRMRFRQDPLLGYTLQPELFFRVAHDLSRTGGRTASRFLAGVIARY